MDEEWEERAYRVDCDEPCTHMTLHSTEGVMALVAVLLRQGAQQIEIKREKKKAG